MANYLYYFLIESSNINLRAIIAVEPVAWHWELLSRQHGAASDIDVSLKTHEIIVASFAAHNNADILKDFVRLLNLVIISTEIFFKCDRSHFRIVTCLSEVVAAQTVVMARVSFETGHIKMCRQDSTPSFKGPANKGSPSRFVCKITVSTHTHEVFCVFKVNPSRCMLFVVTIEKELPITLQVIKGLQ